MLAAIVEKKTKKTTAATTNKEIKKRYGTTLGHFFHSVNHLLIRICDVRAT